eukprot:TRINITY_DN10477_c0_g1_i1.p3 TRINITY_DN10477_c0_g1~~TRINITY_DN10477_c0_g1_i1.p3  ORF type:complete len:208 (-),score=-19.03 TRINITY_DN10477_c0_g1_i1:2124-2747(-)
MIRRPPRSTHCISSAASDVYKRQHLLCYQSISYLLFIVNLAHNIPSTYFLTDQKNKRRLRAKTSANKMRVTQTADASQAVVKSAFTRNDVLAMDALPKIHSNSERHAAIQTSFLNSSLLLSSRLIIILFFRFNFTNSNLSPSLINTSQQQASQTSRNQNTAAALRGINAFNVRSESSCYLKTALDASLLLHSSSLLKHFYALRSMQR